MKRMPEIDRPPVQWWRGVGRIALAAACAVGISACSGASQAPTAGPAAGGNGGAGFDHKLAAVDDPLGLRVQNAARPWSFTDKGGAYRFEVRAGDHIPGDGNEPKERSELYSTRKMEIGRTYDIAFDMKIDPGPPNTAPWLVLMQIQSSFDKGEPGHSPPLSIGLRDERLTIGTNESPMKMATPADILFTRRYDTKTPIKRGVWSHYVIRVRTDPFGAGLLKITRDADTLIDYKGAVGFNDDIGPYFKVGVYRGHAAEPFVVEVKNLSQTLVA